MFRRRVFLKGAVSAAALAGLAPVRLLGGTPYDPAVDGFDQAGFQSLLRSWFHVDADGWKALELVAVESEGVWHSRFQQFSLHFRGPARDAIGTGSFTIVPDGGSAFPIHLQAAGDDGSQATYVACFGIDRPAGGPTCSVSS